MAILSLVICGDLCELDGDYARREIGQEAAAQVQRERIAARTIEMALEADAVVCRGLAGITASWRRTAATRR